ncbi:hypothetical protein ACFQ9X_04455 [Catenulispora yoronensis]
MPGPFRIVFAAHLSDAGERVPEHRLVDVAELLASPAAELCEKVNAALAVKTPRPKNTVARSVSGSWSCSSGATVPR